MSKSGNKNEKSAAETQDAPVSETEEQAVTADEASVPTDEETAAEATETEVEPEPDPLADMTAERDVYQEKWLRVVAELDNVRKRSSRELVQSRKFSQADVLRSFLDVQDNFERALQMATQESDTDAPKAFREGVELIHQKFRGVFKEKGVVPMEALDTVFDPNFHEAVGQLPREGVEPGIVIEIVQQGYNFGDMVLRPARVIISA